MKPRVAMLLLAVLLLLAMGVGAWFALLDETGDAPVAPPPTPAETSAPPPRDSSRRPAGRHGPGAPEPGAETGAAPASKHGDEAAEGGESENVKPREIRVRAVDASGNPVEGAKVRASVDSDVTDPEVWSPTRHATAMTDAEGRATLRFSAWSGHLHAVRGDLAGVISFRRDTDGELTLTLTPARTVRGRVVDPRDAPVARAVVRLTWWTGGFNDSDAEFLEHPLLVVAGEDGRFEFEGVPRDAGAEGGAQFAAWARGFSRTESDPRPEALDAEVVLRLDPASVLRGRCVDERGAPVAKASVQVPSQGIEQVETGADGRFVVEGVPRAGAQIRFLSPDHAPTAVRDLAITTPDHDLGDIVLRKGGKVAGVFVDLAGKPVVGGEVAIHDPDLDWTYEQIVVGDDGKFSFDHVSPGLQTLMGEEPAVEGASWSSTRNARLDGVRPDGGEVRLVLTGALFLHVRFLDAADRSPVTVGEADVRVTPLAEAAEGGGGWGWSGGRIDSVRFDMQEAGPYRVEIEIPGYEKAVVERVEVLADREAEIDVLFRKRPQ